MNRILIVSKKKEIGDALAKLIRPFKYGKIDQTDSAQEAKRKVRRSDYALVIINTPLSHQFGTELALEMSGLDGPDLILLVKNEALPGVERKLTNAPVYIVPKPINRQELIRDIRYILNNRERRETLRAQNEKLKKKLKGTKVLFRAKLVLMEKLEMSEEEAHRYIQKRAMDEGRRPEEISEAIVKFYSK